MTSWRDRRQPGSFRNAKFDWVGDATSSHGRRGVEHEFPLVDDPDWEDLGRSAGKLVINCVTIGDNYDTDRDALIAACVAFGPGTLVHPTRGSLQVAVPDGGCQVRESTKKQGVAFFTIQFLEAAAASSKAPTPLPGTAVSTAADTAIIAVTAAAGGQAGAAPRGDQ